MEARVEGLGEPKLFLSAEGAVAWLGDCWTSPSLVSCW